MLVTKLKYAVAALVLTGLLGFGGAWLTQSAPAREATVPVSKAERDDAPPPVEVNFPDEAVGDRGKREDPAGRKETGVRGLFVAFDEEKGLITLRVGRDEGEESFHLAGKEVKFTSNLGEPLRPKAIPKGALLLLELNELKDVSAVQVIYPTRSLVLSGVNPERMAVRFKADEGEQALKIAPEAKLSLNGKAAKLEEFKAGMRVNLVFGMDKETVLAMAEDIRRDGDAPREGDVGRDKGRREPPDKRFDVLGTITLINAKEGTIDVLAGSEGDPWIKTFTIPKEVKASVKMDRFSREVELSELAKATRVMLNLAEDKKTVTKLVVQPPLIRLVIKAVDAEKNRIVVGEESFALTKETEIYINRRAGKLADITPGMGGVGWLTFDRSGILVLQIFTGDVPREGAR